MQHRRLSPILVTFVVLTLSACAPTPGALGALALVGALAAGGGGGSSPPPPSVIISGNEGEYWQDEEIRITFSPSNMDSSTTSFSVSNLGYDFVVDTSRGVFTAKTDTYTDAGEYSFTVTATDSAGKSASRSFQFKVNATITGSYSVQSPNTSLRSFMRAARDGAFFFQFVGFDESDLVDGYPKRKVLRCRGDLTINGSRVSGDGDCGGFLARSGPNRYDNYDMQLANDFRAVDRISLDLDINDLTWSFEFFGADGGLVERYTDPYIEDLPTSDFLGAPYSWWTNSELVGEYRLLNVANEYEGNGSWGSSNNFRIVVNSDHTISTLDNDENCRLSGEFSQAALDGYGFVHGSDKGLIWRVGERVMSGPVETSGCAISSDAAQTRLPLNQPLISSVITPFWLPISYNYDTDIPWEDPMLLFSGKGASLFIKVCEADGSPTVNPFFSSIERESVWFGSTQCREPGSASALNSLSEEQLELINRERRRVIRQLGDSLFFSH